MLTKILLTTLVIVCCYLYIRHTRGRALAQGSSSPPQIQPSTPAVRYLAFGLVLVSLCAAAGFFLYNWNDNRTILEVRVINPQTGDHDSYQVFKGDMGERRFETIQGRQVSVSDSERVEVSTIP